MCSLTSAGFSMTCCWQGAWSCGIDLRRERVRQRVRELARAVGVVGPAEHLVDHFDVAEQVGEQAMIGLALDVVEQDRAAAVHLLLDRGEFQIGIDLLVGLDQVALGPEPFQGVAQVVDRVDGRAERFFLRSAHEVSSWRLRMTAFVGGRSGVLPRSSAASTSGGPIPPPRALLSCKKNAGPRPVSGGKSTVSGANCKENRHFPRNNRSTVAIPKTHRQRGNR